MFQKHLKDLSHFPSHTIRSLFLGFSPQILENLLLTHFELQPKIYQWLHKEVLELEVVLQEDQQVVKYRLLESSLK
jgi:hypothetical protein